MTGDFNNCQPQYKVLRMTLCLQSYEIALITMILLINLGMNKLKYYPDSN